MNNQVRRYLMGWVVFFVCLFALIYTVDGLLDKGLNKHFFWQNKTAAKEVSEAQVVRSYEVDYVKEDVYGKYLAEQIAKEQNPTEKTKLETAKKASDTKKAEIKGYIKSVKASVEDYHKSK
ncbi:hypothetical protein [Candidatus Phytoplasma meliae]|uniref:Immunodominant membrane protein n=1 Tax=Candidatus Phytoplasma meliae TaxID=1848402 RepID=A0ABS5CZ07_9MOLU|nr:hypothetical protein [Candidatus Phytoplasma meliae]MBP5835780.1 hypothetical protein [Candidatus Phytoplasma meliae]MBP5836209.1 hypothetical protein [Candidatus Phytoplasma meliae]